MRERFVQAMVNEIGARKDFFNNIGSSVTTVYVGGGTPSVLLPGQLGRIVGALRQTFDLSGVEEFTIEVNPNDITPEYAAFLTTLGVNRVSMGMQSFDDSHLKWMNRRHTAGEGIQAYRILREAGINNISLDLIFGYTPLSGQQWEKNIDTMISLAPEHISAYQMSIEPGSRLSAMSRNGSYTPPSDEECLKQYTLLQTKLTAAGYHQYEISNFARQKPAPSSASTTASTTASTAACTAALNPAGEFYVSQHNSSYWDGTPYLGLGPAAHSFSGTAHSFSGAGCNDGSGARRMWNTPSVKKYCSYYCGDFPGNCAGNHSGNHSSNCSGNYTDNYSGNHGVVGVGEIGCKEIIGYEDLTLEDIFNETIMLGLRRTRGFSLDSLASLGSPALLTSQTSHTSEALLASQISPGASLLRDIMPDINRLVMSGQLIMEGRNIRIPADKLFISDSIIRELFV